MLLCQNGGGHEINHLLSVHHRFKGSADGDLRLSVTHVAADQAVHDFLALHVLLGSRDGKHLILRLLKGKHFLKLPLPDRVRPVTVARSILSGGVKLHQIPGDLLHRRAHLGLGLGPLLRPQLIQLRFRAAVRRSVFLDHVKPCRKHIEDAAVPVGNLHVVLHHMLHFHLLNALINPETVTLMHHIVPDLQIIKVVNLLPFIYLFLSLLLFLRTKNIALRNDHKLQKRIFKPLPNPSVSRHHFPRLQLAHGILRVESVQLLIPQVLRQPFGAGSRAGKQQYAVALFLIIF